MMNTFANDPKFLDFYELLESIEDTSQIPLRFRDALNELMSSRNRHNLNYLVSLIEFYRQQIEFREAEIAHHTQQLKRERDIHDWLHSSLSDRFRKLKLVELKTEHFSLSYSANELNIHNIGSHRNESQYLYLKIDLKELKRAIALAEHSSATNPP